MDSDGVCNKKEGWNKDSKWGRSMTSWKWAQKGVNLRKEVSFFLFSFLLSLV